MHTWDIAYVYHDIPFLEVLKDHKTISSVSGVQCKRRRERMLRVPNVNEEDQFHLLWCFHLRFQIVVDPGGKKIFLIF